MNKQNKSDNPKISDTSQITNKNQMFVVVLNNPKRNRIIIEYFAQYKTVKTITNLNLFTNDGSINNDYLGWRIQRKDKNKYIIKK